MIDPAPPANLTTLAGKLGQLGMFAVIEGIIFIMILIVGLVYTWRKGMLEWA